MRKEFVSMKDEMKELKLLYQCDMPSGHTVSRQACDSSEKQQTCGYSEKQQVIASDTTPQVQPRESPSHDSIATAASGTDILIDTPLTDSQCSSLVNPSPAQVQKQDVTKPGNNPRSPRNESGSQSYADAVQLNSNKESKPSSDGFQLVSRKKTKTKSIIGSGVSNSQLKASSGRFSSVFISRLSPDTSCEDIIKYANDSLKLSVKCEKLKSKFDSYASFKIDVVCNNPAMLYNPESWPSGILVRKFFVK